ncbi:MAG: dUTP diphosphatase [Candidatus Paceibacterota bacterium]|jgi:dUTP pyrophosphatase
MKTIGIVKVNDDARIPSYAHAEDAGMDLFSNENDYMLKAGERKGFSTGIKMEIPDGYAGLVWDKSGLAFKNGIKTMAGVIDSTYRGEIVIIMINLGDSGYLVEKGSKIAQMIVQKIEHFELSVQTSIENTSRGEKGFGSTGLK